MSNPKFVDDNGNPFGPPDQSTWEYRTIDNRDADINFYGQFLDGQGMGSRHDAADNLGSSLQHGLGWAEALRLINEG